MSEGAPEPFGPEDFKARTNVSRETLVRLVTLVELLEDWNQRHNLVSRNSMTEVWRRHLWDSAQLLPYIPATARTLADLGSGAGFPGLVLAELLRNRVQVTLFEATRKKADFLDAAARRMGLKVQIRNERIETGQGPFDVITARALASLEKLLAYAQKMAGMHTTCLFLKGQSLASGLTKCHKSWKIKALQHQSVTDLSGVILEVREFHRVEPKPGRA